MRRTPTEGECDYHTKGAHVRSLAKVLSDIIVLVSYHDGYPPVGNHRVLSLRELVVLRTDHQLD